MLVCLPLHIQILCRSQSRKRHTDNEWMRKWMSGTDDNNNWETALANVLNGCCRCCLNQKSLEQESEIKMMCSTINFNSRKGLSLAVVHACKSSEREKKTAEKTCCRTILEMKFHKPLTIQIFADVSSTHTLARERHIISFKWKLNWMDPTSWRLHRMTWPSERMRENTGSSRNGVMLTARSMKNDGNCHAESK